MNIKIILFSLILLFCTTNLYAWENLDYYTYSGTTDELITVKWDQPVDFNALTDDYELVLYNPERDYEIPLAITSELQVTFSTKKTGHWIPKVRSRRYNGTVYLYSRWIESIDPIYSVVVNGTDYEPKGWWIFTWIAATGPIELNIKVDNYEGP